MTEIGNSTTHDCTTQKNEPRLPPRLVSFVTYFFSSATLPPLSAHSLALVSTHPWPLQEFCPLQPWPPPEQEPCPLQELIPEQWTVSPLALSAARAISVPLAIKL